MTNSTQDSEALDRHFQGLKLLLLDFDGPVASLFAGLAAADVASQLRSSITERAVHLVTKAPASDDPLEVLRWAAGTVSAQELRHVEARLVELERKAVVSAAPTAGSERVLRVAAERGVVVRIVSNNSRQAISDYVAAQHLGPLVQGVHGRPHGRPDRMKPDPFTVHEALSEAGVSGLAAVLIGDSASDVAASSAAGVRCVGYANKPGKAARLRAAGATAITGDMHEVAQALLIRPATRACARRGLRRGSHGG